MEWIKLAGSVFAAVAVVWNMIQQHEYRISQAEKILNHYIEQRDDDYKETQRTLHTIQIDIAEIRNRK